jgi:hypothetical protein
MRARSRRRLVLAGQEYHGQRGFFAQFRQEFHAVHLGHLDVEDRQIGRVLKQGAERRFPVRIDTCRKTFCLQGYRYGGQDVAIIVDQRDNRAVVLRDGGGLCGLVLHHARA